MLQPQRTPPTTTPTFGFLIDSARCLENRAYYRAFIDAAADRGARVVLWHFSDDQGCSLRFDHVPAAASPHAYSKAELRELVRYAAGRGVELVPELAALGHCRYLTQLPEYQHLSENGDDAHFTGMCPVSDETRDLFRTLLAEVAEVFEGPNVHVGLDEVNIGGHPLTRAALQTRSAGAILGEYAAFLHGVLQGLGKRMWMWGDCALKHPEMLEPIPRDVVICNWQYSPKAPIETTRRFLDAGFDVMLCSALISHDQTLFPGERFAMPNVRALDAHRALTGRGKILGHIATIWTPVRYLADSLWLAVDLAAATLRAGERIDDDAAIRCFATDFYGFDAERAERFAAAARVLLDESPMRDEWIPAAALRPLSAEMQAAVVAVAPRWTRAATTLAELRPGVRSHGREFDAFSLLLDTIANAYESAAALADARTTPATYATLAARRASIVERLGKDWDACRYADDPRKFAAPIPSFQNDHLLPLMQGGLATLQARGVATNDSATVRPRGVTILPTRGDARAPVSVAP